jgi:hypothetical protein
LEFDPHPFLSGLARLREAKYGAKMETYSPPSESLYDAMFSNNDNSPLTPEEYGLRKIYAQWFDLHSQTKDNLLQFEAEDFQLASGANGEVAVTALVSGS